MLQQGSEVVFYGWPKAWVDAPLKVEDLGYIPSGKGYRLLEPGETLRRLNERLIDQNLSHSTFATALYGTIDVETLQVNVARAGHPHPIVVRSDGTTEALHAEGSLLGIFPDEAYPQYSAQLRAGDRLLIYTDGLDVAFADIRDRDRIRELIEERRPDVIFHTAALKHLPLLEMYPDEGIKTNVALHRRILADPDFQAGRVDTSFMERFLPEKKAAPVAR